MLLRFNAKNYLSVSDVNELSLVASNLKGPEDSLMNIAGTQFKAVPSAIIYGANASGKTNILKAFGFLRRAVLQSHAQGSPEGGVPRMPFMLNPNKENETTILEAEFILDNVRMQYGFECNDNVFVGEWLYSYPEGKRRKLFERKGSEVEFGSHFRGAKKILVDLMRPNSLFISTATQNDHEELGNIVSFFRRVKFSMNVVVAKELINNNFKKDQVDPRTIAFLNAIGTGITGFRQSDVQLPEAVQALTREFAAIVRKHMGDTATIEDENSERMRNVAIEFQHSASGVNYYLGLERESSGTRRLLLIMNAVFKTLDEGGIIVIDELDASLHTLAASEVLKLFQDKHINKRGAQLIATTHDTNLLSNSGLRRDQIWFCQKDDDGASYLFPLSDIKSRPSDDFQKGYLEGRYGAIPYSGNVSALFGGH